MQNFDISIGINEVRKVNAQGSFLRYYSGSAAGLDETILVTYDGGSVILKAGQSVKLPDSVSEWLISNYKKQAPIIGVIVIGDGEILDSSIAGSVSVIDGGMARTDANSAFLMAGGANPVAGQYMHLQIYNPVGSGKNAFIESLQFSSAAAGSVILMSSDTPLSAAMGYGISKKIGGVYSGAYLGRTTSATVLGLNLMMANQVSANIVQTVNYREPIMLAEGKGITLVSQVLGVQINANFEFFEQAI